MGAEGSRLRSRIAVLLGVPTVALLCCWGFAPSAPAETYVVDSAVDTSDGGGCGVEQLCNLRGAINRANEHANQGGQDRIEFAIGEYVPELGEGPLPAISDPVVIDGTTVPGYAGVPLVFINGELVHGEGGGEFPTALEVHADDTVIEGVAFGNFAGGVYVEGARNARLCGDWFGLHPTETGPGAFSVEDAPQVIGVETAPDAIGTQIGAGCGATGGNVIGNSEWSGIADFGEGSAIAANLIGVLPDGGHAPNGTEKGAAVPASGIAIGGEAVRPHIGATKTDPGNVIAFNDGVGVVVGASASGASIRANSIHSNGGRGIEIESSPPPVPHLQTYVAGPAGTSVIGTLTGKPSTTYELDFFSNAACDPSGDGEGETYLGPGTVTTDGSGKASVSAGSLAGLLLGQGHVTATATESTTGATSEFSNCAGAGAAPGPEPPIPDNGRSVVIGLVSGKVLVKPPGASKFHPLGEDEEVPVGSIVDATNGKVRLSSTDPSGRTQTAEFYAGAFKVTQKKGTGLVVLKLVGGDFSSCRKKGGAASASGRRGRRLWGSGKGDFRSEGRHGSATVRGTIWLTEDRCDATFFRTARGVVTVRDFDAGRTVKVPKGKTYLTQ